MLRHLTLTLLSIFAAIPAIAHVETAPSFAAIDHETAFTRADVAGEISLPAIELFEPATRLTPFPSKRKLASGSSTSLAGINYLEPRELSAESWQGHDYMHARYYSPVMGRFLSVDPGKDWDPKQPQSWNSYAYVRNNPLNMVDPDGEAATLVTAGVGALTGAGFQIAINIISGDDWDEGVVKEMAIGGGLGLTGIGIAKVFDKGLEAYRAAKAGQAAVAASRNIAYELAAQGGKHAGTLRNYAGRTATEVAKGVQGHERQVLLHAQKLKDPAKFAERWGQMSTREQQGLLRKWEKDMQRNKEMADVLRGLLERMHL